MKLAAGAVVLGVCPQALAHGLRDRYDLPMPLWLWVVGAGAPIIFTFGISSIFITFCSVVCSGFSLIFDSLICTIVSLFD